MSVPHSTIQALSVAVITVSDHRSAADDSSGDLLCQLLAEAGHQLHSRRIVPHHLYQLRAEVSALIAAADCAVILLNGGTGFTPGNCTVAAITRLFDETVPGFAEIFRQLSFTQIGSASLQSNAVAGLANDTLVVAMPGSPGACELAMQQLILPQLCASTRPCNFVKLLSQAAADNDCAGTPES